MCTLFWSEQNPDERTLGVCFFPREKKYSKPPLTVELLCLQLCLGAFCLQLELFTYSWSFILAIEAFFLAVGKCI